MGMTDRIRARRARGRGLIAWLVDRSGWRWVTATVLDQVAAARRARKGENDPLAVGADAVGDAVGQTGEGTE